MERHVDLWTKRSSVHSTIRADDEGPRPREGTKASGSAPSQRQRMDITRPPTIAPKPIAKFHAPIDTMKGIRSPAT